MRELADARLGRDASAVHRLFQARVGDEGVAVGLGREVEVDDDVLGVIDDAVDPVLERAVPAANGLVLVEDGLPRVVVAYRVVDAERDADVAVGVALPLAQRRHADARLAGDTGSLHRLRQRRVVAKALRRLGRREVVVDDEAVGIVDVLVETVLDLAVGAPDGLVLVEDRLPGVEVLDEMVDDEDDPLAHAVSSRDGKSG